MPAVRGRERMYGGRRPKSLEGGNRGGVRAGGGIGLWGFNARRWVAWSFLNEKAGCMSEATVILVGVVPRCGAEGFVLLRWQAALTAAIG